MSVGSAVRGLAAENDALPPDAFSPIARTLGDGTLAFCGSYDGAVLRLYEYERSGVLPEDAQAGRVRNHWERYTVKASDGRIYPRRGCELVLGRLRAYESSGLAPQAWGERYGKYPARNKSARRKNKRFTSL